MPQPLRHPTCPPAARPRAVGGQFHVRAQEATARAGLGAGPGEARGGCGGPGRSDARGGCGCRRPGTVGAGDRVTGCAGGRALRVGVAGCAGGRGYGGQAPGCGDRGAVGERGGPSVGVGACRPRRPLTITVGIRTGRPIYALPVRIPTVIVIDALGPPGSVRPGPSPPGPSRLRPRPPHPPGPARSREVHRGVPPGREYDAAPSSRPVRGGSRGPRRGAVGPLESCAAVVSPPSSPTARGRRRRPRRTSGSRRWRPRPSPG